MEFLNKKQKFIVCFIGTIIFIFIGYYVLNKTEEPKILEFNEKELESIQEDEIQDDDIIHITGEVENEGIVKIKKNSRIADVIEKAGGVTEEADLSKVNLAYEVKDGQKINIPNFEEDEQIEEYVTEDAGENVLPEEERKNGKVNINTAKQTELETLSGIGPSTALKIINYRDENGEFKSIEDLKNVPGIGDSKFENIKDDICV